MWLKVKDKTGHFVRFNTDTIARYRPNVERNPKTQAPEVAGTLAIFTNGDDNVLQVDVTKLDAIVKPQEV